MSLRQPIVLAALAGVLFFVNLGGAHLWDVDEAIFAQAAREMHREQHHQHGLGDLQKRVLRPGQERIEGGRVARETERPEMHRQEKREQQAGDAVHGEACIAGVAARRPGVGGDRPVARGQSRVGFRGGTRGAAYHERLASARMPSARSSSENATMACKRGGNRA